MTQYFKPVLEALLTCSERDDGDESNLRISSYEVINSFITNSATSTNQLVEYLIPVSHRL